MNIARCRSEQPGPYCERARERAIARAFITNRPSADAHAALTSYGHCLNRQRQWAHFLWGSDFDFFVTINSNDSTFNYNRGRSAIKKFGALVDRQLLGRNWHKFSSDERTFFAAIPERAGGELHYHILLKFPPKAQHDTKSLQDFGRGFKRRIEHKRIFPRGDADVGQLTGHGELVDSGNQFKTTCYVAKDLWQEEISSNVILSNEFHLPRK
jgi:hypothetical protein